jgi:thymidine kinase
MFSGKTTALIRRLDAARAGGARVHAVKPALDTRYRPCQLVSHDGLALDAIEMDDVARLAEMTTGAHMVGIDEVHFFDGRLVTACLELCERGIAVITAGVDLDHRGAAFEIVDQLANAAGAVTRLEARCGRCGSAARYTQRLVAGDARIIVGGIGAYEPRCERCFRASEG